MRLDVSIEAGGNADATEVDRFTRRLLADIKALDVESAEMSRTALAAPGAKGDPVTLGTLAITILPAVLPKLIELLTVSLRGNADRTIRIKTRRKGKSVELECTGKSTREDLERLVQALTGGK